MSRAAEDLISTDTAVGIVTQGGDGRRWFLGLAACVGGAAVVGLVVALLSPVLFPATLARRAQEIVNLPKGARVVGVNQKGKARGEGDVWFTLVEPAGPGSREEEIWRMNSLPPIPRSTPVPAATPAVALEPIHRLGGKPVRHRPVMRVAPPTSVSPYVPVRSGYTLSVEYGAGNRVMLEFDPGSERYHYSHHVDYSKEE